MSNTTLNQTTPTPPPPPMTTTTNQELPKVILVGRHTPVGLDGLVEVVDQRNIIWSTDVDQCEQQLVDLFGGARKVGAKVLFQNVPGVLGAVFTRRAGLLLHSAGIIVSVPNIEARETIKKTTTFSTAEDAQNAAAVADMANSRGKYTVDGCDLNVEVDGVMPFKLDKIIWL